MEIEQKDDWLRFAPDLSDLVLGETKPEDIFAFFEKDKKKFIIDLRRKDVVSVRGLLWLKKAILGLSAKGVNSYILTNKDLKVFLKRTSLGRIVEIYTVFAPDLLSSGNVMEPEKDFLWESFIGEIGDE